MKSIGKVLILYMDVFLNMIWFIKKGLYEMIVEVDLFDNRIIEMLIVVVKKINI